MSEGNRFRGSLDSADDRLLLVGEEVAREVDRAEFAPAVRNLLGMISLFTVAQGMGTRRRVTFWGAAQAALLTLILWRVW